MVLNKWVLLSKLRKAVKKIRFILNFNNVGHRWRLASILGSSSFQRLSFSDRPGLRELAKYGAEDQEEEECSFGSPIKTSALQRTRSHASDDQDIDNRAEMFIANFYKQLQIERQVSLELRYLRGNSLDSVRSDY